jgi:hypothetical protein
MTAPRVVLQLPSSGICFVTKADVPLNAQKRFWQKLSPLLASMGGKS